jgi:hypothetical protein
MHARQRTHLAENIAHARNPLNGGDIRGEILLRPAMLRAAAAFVADFDCGDSAP